MSTENRPIFGTIPEILRRQTQSQEFSSCFFAEQQLTFNLPLTIVSGRERPEPSGSSDAATVLELGNVITVEMHADTAVTTVAVLVLTGSDGRWVQPTGLTRGTYTFLNAKPGQYASVAQQITVT